MSHRRVVVTGMGIVSPIGNSLASAWASIEAGRSGIGPITHFDASAYATRIAGEVRDFDAKSFLPPKDVKKMDTFIHYGLAACFQAMDDAGLEVTEANAERIGAIIGAGIGGVRGIEETAITLHEGGPRKVSPFYVPSTIINMLPGQLTILKGIKGPNFSAVSACATSNHSIGMAMRMINLAGDGNGYVGNLDLKPETAKTWNIGAIWQSEGFAPDHDLRIIVDYFDIETEDQIGQIADPLEAPHQILGLGIAARMRHIFRSPGRRITRTPYTGQS